MLNYIVAIATAATLFISPMMANGSEVNMAKKKAPIVSSQNKVVIQDQIIVTSPPPVYIISKMEQSILRSALLKSVKVISTGQNLV